MKEIFLRQGVEKEQVGETGAEPTNVMANWSLEQTALSAVRALGTEEF